MAKSKKTDSKDSSRGRTALTPEARESQMIALSMDLAEKQLREGTASSQVISHFLKLGSTKERIEKEIRLQEKKLIEAKTENLQAAQRMEELYAKAIKAFRLYSGEEEEEEENYDEY